MTFSRLAKLPCRPAARRAAAVLSTAVLAVLLGAGLVACGGGTSQLEAFEPKRYFALGDETSSLEPNGRKFGVNGVDAAGRLDCASEPNWVQQVAASYGFAFAECNPGFLSDTNARMLARPGATVADVLAQVETQVAAGGFRDKDLATILAGTNDILALYAQYPARSEASLMADARATGEALARIVNRLVDLGVKVVVSNVPDAGLTPFGIAQKATFNDIDRGALLSRLTVAFNEQLGVKVLLDGRFVGLVQADLRLQAMNRSPGSFGLSNVTNGVCTVALPSCTTATLVPDAAAGIYLWADDTRLAPAGQSQLAGLAIDRARRNPF